MEVISQPPDPSTLRPLSDFQSQTPSSFHGGPPILHVNSSGIRLLVSVEDLYESSTLSKIVGGDCGLESIQNGDHTHRDHHEQIVPGIDIWVTSEKLILFNRTGCVGLAIPYPDISVHALQRREDPATKEDVQTIYLQITKSNSFDDHDPDETISLTLFPASAGPSHEGTEVQSGEVGVDETSAEIRGPAMELFNAISACSSLHPGPASPSSSLEEGIRNQGLESDDAGASETLPSNGLPAAVPGSGGWITAENMHNFFDEEGNWRGGGLGRGAGITRAREDEGTNGDPSVEDSGGDTKWRRTD